MTSDPEGGSDQSGPDIETILARLAPPDTPLDAISRAPNIHDAISPLDPLKTVDILAGLMTEARFQANATRLDFAIRIVLALGTGRRRPKQANLKSFLNDELSAAGVARLEDPIEDFFVESLPTDHGDFLLLPGYWEKALIHTETIIQAFSRLKGAPIKTATLRRIYALLVLSNALVRRAELERRTIGSGEPNGSISVPSDARLGVLARRTRFSWVELSGIGVTAGDLEPFFPFAK
jgi:hypothetical protein